MPWRNHAQGSKHRHFSYPSTWRCGVNPGRFGGACGRRSGLQCRGCGRPFACHSLLRLTQPGVRGSACCRFGESATGRPDNCHQSRKPAANPAGGAARADRSQAQPRPIRNTRAAAHPEHAPRPPRTRAFPDRECRSGYVTPGAFLNRCTSCNIALQPSTYTPVFRAIPQAGPPYRRSSPRNRTRKTGLRTHWHHQHHHPVRRANWNAMKPQIQCVLTP
jgi:hypothetical protein